jgi:hypothetical protein
MEIIQVSKTHELPFFFDKSGVAVAKIKFINLYCWFLNKSGFIESSLQ